MEIITIRSIILLVFFTSITVAYSNNQFGTFTFYVGDVTLRVVVPEWS